MTIIEGLLAAHLADAGIQPISGMDVTDYIRAPFGLWCRYHAPEEERAEVTAFLDMILEAGQSHEHETIEGEFPQAARQPHTTMEEGFEATLQMMERGEREIHAMPLLSLPHGLRGVPDVLQREDAHSVFGNYRYRVVEIKLARNLRREHFIQAAFYTLLLGQIQESTPEEFHLVNGDRSWVACDFSEYESELDHAILETRSIVSGDSSPQPCYGYSQWPWQTFGDRLAIENRDVSLISGVGPVLQSELHQANFIGIEDVARSRLDELLDVRGVGPAKARRLLPKAKALTSAQAIRLDGPIDLPDSGAELFFDMEGDEIGEPLVYLIGVIARVGTKTAYHSFFAETPACEEEQFRAFLNLVGTLDAPVFYHWHQYERRHLERMMSKYEIRLGLQRKVLTTLVDLHPIATKAFAFPSYEDTLKGIARSLGFDWRLPDVNALVTIAYYQEFLNTRNPELSQRISTYNEDDCLATMRIKDWLVERAD